jgi:hypothetical protein
LPNLHPSPSTKNRRHKIPRLPGLTSPVLGYSSRARYLDQESFIDAIAPSHDFSKIKRDAYRIRTSRPGSFARLSSGDAEIVVDVDVVVVVVVVVDFPSV